ncbi:hypothetical protein WJX82_005972 [Trebouxia sp. C0006]
MAIDIAETTHQPPSVPLRLPVFMSLPAKNVSVSQEIDQAQETCCLGPPGPLQLVFVRRGHRLFRVDLIGVPTALPIYVSMARRDNGLSQEQMDMHRWAISPAASDLRASKAAAMYMKLRSFQGNDLIIDVFKGHHQHLSTLAVVLWALVMQQAVRGVDYMTTGVNGDLRSLLRITMKPSKPGLGFMQARATPVEVSAQPRLSPDPSELPATKIADGTAQEPLEEQPEVAQTELSAARSQREDAQEQSNNSQQIRQEIAYSHCCCSRRQRPLFSSSQGPTSTLSVATQTSEGDAISAGQGPSALALLSVKRKLSARDGASPAEACFIPAGYGLEAADPVAEEEAASADHSRNAVINADQRPSLATASSVTATAGITTSTRRFAFTRFAITATTLTGVLSADQAIPEQLQPSPGMPDGVVADTSPNYTAWLAGSMLNRLEADANNRGGQMGTLDLEEQRDLLAGGGSDAQAMYNVAVMHAVNDEVVAAQQRPAPILQQPQPLRRPPTTPNEVAHSVHRRQPP